MERKRHFLSVLVSMALLFLCFPFGVHAEDMDVRDYTKDFPNTGDHDYVGWDRVTNSYLFKDTNGFLKVQANNTDLLAEYYDHDFIYQSTKKIPLELPVFGAFYASDDRYFVVSGQINDDESDSLEVFRITEYDHDWNKLGSDGILGGNTTYPFHAGARCTSYGNIFVVRTSHIMYKSSDGYNHQANVTLLYDTNTHKITEADYGVSHPVYSSFGYSSHSFSQRVVMDGKNLIAADHGDAYPRSFVLFNCGDISGGRTQMTDNHMIEVMEFPGETGNNTTDAKLGGIDVGNSHYVMVGTAGNGTDLTSVQNVFFASVDKDFSKKQITWLTHGEYNSVSRPYLVQLGNGNFLVMFTTDGTSVHCGIVDENGDTYSGFRTIPGILSSAEPAVDGNMVYWYGIDTSHILTFYCLNTDTLQVSTFVESNTISIDGGNITVAVDQSKQLTATVQPDAAANKSVVWSSSDPSIAAVDTSGKVTGRKEGTVTITATAFNGRMTDSRTVTVRPFNTIEMYRMYNPNSGEHFYTANESEKEHLACIGWNDEGIGWIAPETSSTPVYRMYNANGGEHHYTTKAGERDMLVKAGWKYEGIGWYSDDNETVPLYRQYNPNQFACNHNYTTSKAENDYLVSIGWTYEGIGWYAVDEGRSTNKLTIMEAYAISEQDWFDQIAFNSLQAVYDDRVVSIYGTITFPVGERREIHLDETMDSLSFYQDAQTGWLAVIQENLYDSSGKRYYCNIIIDGNYLKQISGQ